MTRDHNLTAIIATASIFVILAAMAVPAHAATRESSPSGWAIVAGITIILSAIAWAIGFAFRPRVPAAPDHQDLNPPTFIG